MCCRAGRAGRPSPRGRIQGEQEVNQGEPKGEQLLAAELMQGGDGIPDEEVRPTHRGRGAGKPAQELQAQHQARERVELVEMREDFLEQRLIQRGSWIGVSGLLEGGRRDAMGPPGTLGQLRGTCMKLLPGVLSHTPAR